MRWARTWLLESMAVKLAFRIAPSPASAPTTGLLTVARCPAFELFLGSSVQERMIRLGFSLAILAAGFAEPKPDRWSRCRWLMTTASSLPLQSAEIRSATRVALNRLRGALDDPKSTR